MTALAAVVRLGCAMSVALAAGCGPRHLIENPSPFEEDDPRSAAGPASDASSSAGGDDVEAAPAEDDGDDNAPGAITRADLDIVLETGPGPYMRGVDVEPVTASGDDSQLVGWRLLKWDYRWVDLRAGDIILSINDVVIIRPDDVDELWAALAGATELVIRFERGGRERSFTFDIE